MIARLTITLKDQSGERRQMGFADGAFSAAPLASFRII
jgi:hypothetical protein